MGFNVFPYREEEPRPDGTAISRPTVDVTVSHQGHVSVRALLDTGAPRCVFSRAIADIIDIDMSPRAGPDMSLRILGGEHQARLAHVTLELPPFDGLSWETEVAFLYGDLDLSFAGLLGSQGFFDRWVASFNYYDNYFVVEERETFVSRLGVDPYEVFREQFDNDWQRPTPH